MGEDQRLAVRTAALGIGVAVVVLALKAAAWAVSGSAALYADALESVVNVASALGAWAVLLYSARPADRNHPWGHHKAEYFSAVAIGALIVLAALSIAAEAWAALDAPALGERTGLGIAVNLVATAINAAWCRRLLSVGRRARSPGLVADGRHLGADVVTSLGAAAGLGLALATGLAWLDPAVALLVAANVLWSGSALIRGSVGALMDEAADAETVARVEAAIAENAAGSIEAHDVRARRAGRVVFVEFHLVVPSAMTVAEAHRICDRLEEAIARAVPGARATIHVEPEGKAKQEGVVL